MTSDENKKRKGEMKKKHKIHLTKYGEAKQNTI